MTRIKKPDSEWSERQKNIMAQGRTGTTSKDASQYIQGVYPSHTRGDGHRCYLFDAWSNRYVDFIGGLGAISLGYGNERVTEAVIRQARKGASFSLPTTLEVEVAETLGGLIASAEKIRFFKNGRDASDCAIRIARTYTNRDVIASDGYHGCSDIWTSLTPPSLGVKDEHKIVPLEKVNDVERSRLAAVIVEAIKLDDGPEYLAMLRELREQCRRAGTVFIIDEIITGFRVPKWTASNLWSLDPDIILLGKGMANGWPLAAIGGKRELLDCGEWFFSTTFSGEATSLAACQATIEEIGQKSLTDLMFYGKRLQAKLNNLHSDIKFSGYGTRAMLNTTNETTALFMQEMCKANFLFGKAFFFNFSHLEENIEDLTMNTANAVVENIKMGRVKLEGQMPREVFKR